MDMTGPGGAFHPRTAQVRRATLVVVLVPRLCLGTRRNEKEHYFFFGGACESFHFLMAASRVASSPNP